ncbi:hypothetical protein GWK47_004350 [Chionoecetes opilio]|uniref:DUF4789 domain-containing protein n=1 Tax=Chionoecetes opilio TaxID=41210 RepID=A0A8J4YR46_CHIOP|nr:hypothetical protein GWK47_004350 [Chionoecetes opilio]
MNEQIDPCARDEVLVGATCARLLTQGPCAKDEYVLLDPGDNKGFCAARLCTPDRIFVFSDQLCHDPLNSKLCPTGRQLYQTGYGTPLCQCPDGTYEGVNDLNDDVCRPLLSNSLCPSGKVFWFKDFSSLPECLPDPCGGKNLNRGSSDLPFVPSAETGECYQLGQTWYALALQTLRGVCVSLEDAGYQVFDKATLDYLKQQYGPFIVRENIAPSLPPASDPISVVAPSPAPSPGTDSSPAVPQQTPGQASGTTGNQGSSSGGTTWIEDEEVHHLPPPRTGQQSGGTTWIEDEEVHHLPPPRTGQQSGVFTYVEDEEVHHITLPRTDHPRQRGRRSTLPHASPGSVIEPGLAACRAGAQRDVNAKCRDIVLPTSPPGREVRAAPPVPPRPACPEGQAYGSKRTCVPHNEALTSINAFNLGK